MNATGSWGTPMTVAQPPKRFAVRYHLAHVGDGPTERVRIQVWLDDGQEVPSVVGVWPTADWHEREQYDLMGIHFAGHPNLRRLIMPTDWAGPSAPEGLPDRRRAGAVHGRGMSTIENARPLRSCRCTSRRRSRRAPRPRSTRRPGPT